jgi:hypothetical protein
MSKALPTSPPEPAEVDLDTMMRWDQTWEHGYYLVVDYDVPPELHDALDYAPVTHKIINGTKKLVASLESQQDYGLHVSLLQTYVRLGLRVRIKRAWRFTQAPILRKYFDELGKMRAASKDELFRDVVKLCANTVYGKLIENILKRVNMQFIVDPRKWEEVAGTERAKNFNFIGKDDNFLGTVETLPRGGVTIDTPRFIGNIVLDYAKTHMMEFHYDVVRRHFGDRATLLYTDTDSLIYHVRSEDFVAELRELSDHLDLSMFGDDANKGVLGKFKPENNIVVDDNKHYATGLEYVGVGPKVYSVAMACVVDDQRHDDYVKRNKGVPKHKVAKMAHDRFLRQIHDPVDDKITYNAIRCRENVPYHTVESKRVLPLENTKVHRASPLASRPIGHWRN